MTTGPKVKSRIGRFDLGLVLVLLAPILAFYPLLPSGFPPIADAALHLYRVVEFDAVLRSGVIYPRWAPDFAFGYGYPIFNYYAPLLYYLTELPLLVGVAAETSLRFIVFGTFFLYGFGAYWWTRPILGSAPAVVAAVAYVFVPYRFQEAYLQGDYPQFLALALAPLALGAAQRMFAGQRMHVRWLVLLVMFLSAILLSHNISAMLLAPVVAIYALALAVARALDPVDPSKTCGSDSRGGRPALQRLGWAAVAATLAVGGTAFFWLPALAERNLVQLSGLTSDDYDIRNHFTTVTSLLAPPQVVDRALANPQLYFHLGWGQLLLAFLTLILLPTVLIGRQHRKNLPTVAVHLVFGWGVFLGGAAMTLKLSTPIWLAVPLLTYTEFPTRMLGVAAIGQALLAGLAVYLAIKTVRLLSDRIVVSLLARAVILSLATVVLIVPSLVYLYARQPFDSHPHLTPADAIAFERAVGAVGTTSIGEFYPRDVKVRPTLELPRNLNLIGRLDRTSVPTGTDLSFDGGERYTERYRVALQSPSTLRFNVIWFPGWEVRVDGRGVPTGPSSPQGLVVADVPAGTHNLTLEFVDTPIRTVGWIIAGASAIGLIGLVAFRIRTVKLNRDWKLSPRSSDGVSTVPLGVNHAWTLDRSAVIAVSGVLVTLLLLRVVQPPAWDALFTRTSPIGSVVGVSHPLHVNLGDKIELLGYDVDAATVHPGGQIKLKFYWRALQKMATDYRTFATVARVGDKRLLAGDDRTHPGGIPTRSWGANEYVVDEHTIDIPANAPPSVYQLQIALYDPKNFAYLKQPGVPGFDGEQYVLQQIHVTRVLPVDHSLYRTLGDPSFGGVIRLNGFSLSSNHVRAGQTLQLTLLWQGERPIASNYTVFTHLINAKQDQVAGHDSVPLDGQYPTSTWLVGEDVVDPHPIVLPADLPSGQYHLTIGIYDAKSLQRLDITTAAMPGNRNQIDLDDVPILVDAGT